MQHLPAILIDGPKGVGKTATALQRAGTVRRLDEPAQRVIAQGDPAAVLEGEAPVLLDEWHRVPDVWDAVKRAVDRSRQGGQFLLTGSAPQGASHSGAGRITTLRMRPMTISERRATTPSVSLAALLGGEAPITGTTSLRVGDYTDLILRSGLPGLRGLPDDVAREQLDSYLSLIVERDLDEAGLRVRRPATVLAWLRAYAAATATTTSWEKIRDAASAGTGDKPARSTTLPYVDTLSHLRILDEVEAWLPSSAHLTRLAQAPKHHLADPALAARLVGVGRSALLAGEAGVVEMPRDGSFLGALFESLATLSVRAFAEAAGAKVAHLRTFEGRREIDLIVERDDGAVLAIEVTLAAAVTTKDTRHLTWLRETLGERVAECVVLSAGPQAYRRPDGVAVVPLALLGP